MLDGSFNHPLQLSRIMTDFPYLISMALIEQDGKRAMPIGGKSIKEPIRNIEDIFRVGEPIALQLLVRVLERSEKGTLRRVAHEKSLVFVQLPMEVMNNKLPLLKSEWIETGDTKKFFSKLKSITSSIWGISFIKHQGLILREL